MNPTDELPEDLVRVADQLRQVRTEPPLESPDPALLDRIHATLGSELSSPSPAGQAGDPADSSLQRPHPSHARPARTTPRLTRRAVLIGGAVGLGVGAVSVVAADRLRARATVLAKASLRALSEAAPELGRAELVDTRSGLQLDIRTNDPIDFNDGFLEVWLLNSDGERLVSIGLFRPGDQGSYPIDRAVYDEGFVIVDISRQRYDEGLDHSGDSVMRGPLEPE